MDWVPAPDVQTSITDLVEKLDMQHVDTTKIICFRSFGSSSRARARIWSFPRVWQLALNLSPHYVIEVLHQYFDKMSQEDKLRVLIHELMHIPKNFSGSLVPHRTRHGRIDHRSVEKLFNQYKAGSVKR